MGILIEFELARAANMMLENSGIHDLFWTYVIANRFPDLEIRKTSGERLLRMEVKCLQARAEEKSANFGTLIKDIDPNTDFLIVCLWEWDPEINDDVLWDRAPLILDIFVFHAYSLALLRDFRWLNTPPSGLGGGYQGYDIRSALTCRAGHYSKEQGNYGKLLRIWSNGLEYNGPHHELLNATIGSYVEFTKLISTQGFKSIAEDHFRNLGMGEPQFTELESGALVAFTSQIAYLYSASNRDLKELLDKNRFSYIVKMGSKYKATLYASAGNKVDGAINIKPKTLLLLLRSRLLNHYEDLLLSDTE
ncbi:hypothetical protein [Schaalia sp. lx-260]|uniref:hypothetical protein n=1 Tax=Schaalia sp. lx-260 TaxID=2899082 RepID=UPI001E63DD72|nr:hypothetical protein [Schaalia sp. lx-260]MCD4549134.1 hypothetical protein [Schaalia sp. lx-260]